MAQLVSIVGVGSRNRDLHLLTGTPQETKKAKKKPASFIENCEKDLAREMKSKTDTAKRVTSD